MKKLILALVAALTLSGCVTNPETGRRELTESGKLALQESLLIVGERQLGSLEPAQIEKVRAVLTALQADSGEEFTTIDGLAFILQSRIERLPDAKDRQDFSRLVRVFTPVLEETVGAGQLSPEATLRIKDFFGMLLRALPEPAK